jgi:hypothetical protein
MVKNASSTGSSLIEVLVITVLVATILTAISGLVAQSLKNTAQNKQKALATDLAQQGLEMFRQRRESLGWASFQEVAVDGTYCLNTMPTSDELFAAMEAGACDVGETIVGTEFTREAEVDSSLTEVIVTVTVSWPAGTTPQTVTANQEFHDIEN